MNLELPARAVATVAAFFAVSAAVLLFMLAKLGALPAFDSGTRSVQVVFANAEGLPAQADVLVHGVKVGSVSGVTVRASGRTLVTLSLASGAPRLHPDASAAVGFKTPLGEPFLDLHPGHRPGREMGPLRARTTVEIDDALAFLNRTGRSQLRASLLALGRGAASPDTGVEASDLVGELEPTTAQLAHLVGELSSQRATITSIVRSGRVVLDTLASRGQELGSLMTDAAAAVRAVADQRKALTATLRRLPGVLGAADATLGQARPLIHRATPLLAAVDSAAPSVTGALNALPRTAGALDSLLGQAPALRQTVVPALTLIRGLAGPGASALRLMGPTLADLIPVARYLGPRGRTIAAWFANTAALGSHGDAKGRWARFFVTFDRSTLTGRRAGAPPGNSYTAPGDAAHNQPYRTGDFQRLEPYWPALAPRR
ncbi:MAG: MlaD family protein [Solirubrobacteraceae bacterium]